MSYDLDLCDPVTGAVIELDFVHHMRGGTYAVGGTSEASLNVTYNYGQHYYRVLNRDMGLRCLDGQTGATTIPVLEAAVAMLGDDVSDDYWEPTEGNAKRALLQLLTLAQLRPDGVWKVS